ncbi:MAG: thiamine/thiamine pyrophosphate ABC transporter permease ThiP [Rhodobacteraceae bacterium]|jgi:thiamine transport system permease protein|nr:thiamine/thiamine pyrophosphate ABC transporter permease ThiP [Paracoccaceae bacterium]
MARSPVALGAGVAVAALVLVPLGAVMTRAGGWPRLAPGDLDTLWFTLWQAGLSALVSVALAVPVARALARRRFRGRGALVLLMGAPFILPVIVAVLGILAVWGRAGWVSDGMAAAGLPRLDIYGLPGILLAHVFFNLPLAVRLILIGWLSIPAERFRLAASLNLPEQTLFRVIEWPMLRAVLPGAFAVIFLICTGSFAVALTLGGGPAATTVELAIFQAFRFDADLTRAAGLALMQVVLTLAAAALAARVALPAAGAGGLDRVVERWDAAPLWRDGAWIALAAAFLLAPLLAVLWRGAPGVVDLPWPVWAAAARSVTVAVLSTGLTLALALPLALAAARGAQWAEWAGYVPLSASALVLGTGLYLILFPLADPRALALPVTAVVNATLALPFALRALVPEASDVQARHGRLAEALRLRGWARVRVVDLPRLRRPLGFAAGLTAALSLGDLGAITLFADADRATLPLHIHGLMSAYRMEDATAAALVLVALALSAFWICDRWGRGHAAA